MNKLNKYNIYNNDTANVECNRQTDRQKKSFIYPFVHSITVTVIPIN